MSDTHLFKAKSRLLLAATMVVSVLDPGLALAQAPTVSTGAASSIALTGATLNGSVNPNGTSTTAVFQYGRSWQWGVPTNPNGPAAHSGSKVWARDLRGNYGSNEDGYITSPSIDLSSLVGQTPVLSWWQWLRSEPLLDHGSVDVSRDGGGVWIPVYDGTGDADPWARREVTLDSTYAVSDFRLRFRFRSDDTFVFPGYFVDDVAISTVESPGSTVYAEDFEASDGGFALTIASYGQTVSLASPGAGTSAVPVSAGVSGLTCNTQYHFRVVATNLGGPANGGDAVFTTTACPPTVTTGVADSVTPTGATLNGTVNPNGGSTTASFEYGTTVAYGSTTTSQSLGSGVSAVPLSGGAITGLTCETTYHFRAVATNAGGTTNGLDATFTTPTCPPTATTGAASGITLTGATLNGSVNPNGTSTTAVFQYGRSWEWGVPTNPNGPVAHSGSKVWARDLKGNYGNNEDGYITSPSIDLSSLVGQTPVLSSWQWLRSEPIHDHGSVEVSRDGGGVWTSVYDNTGDANVVWGRREVTLDSTYAVSNFRFRFRFRSDDSSVFPGYFVDDVAISTVESPGSTVYAEDFEASDGGFALTIASYGQTVSLASPGDGTSAVPVSAEVSGLTCSTEYHFRVSATNLGGPANGGDAVFTTTACPPTVTTGVAGSVTPTGATLNGTVNPNGGSTTASFEYGTTVAYGSTTTSQSLGSGVSAVPLSGGAITGLICETTYHFRAVATNAGGTTNGLDATFTTPTCPPTATTGAASGITLTGATLNGSVNPNGTSTTALFQYGTTASYGGSTTSESLGSGTSAVSLTGGALSGLTCGTVYHFRVVATNVGGPTNGLDATFATTACPPAVSTGVASSITPTGATLNGTVNPNGAATTASFEYGPTTSYGSATTSQSLGSGTSAVSLSGGAITGLTCETTYHFRARATNIGGTTNGLDASFTTATCPPTATTGAASSITLTGATLNGTVNPNGALTTASFEYGTTVSYGSTTTSQSLGSGTSGVSLSGGAITGLTCGTTYHFRVVATNAGGTTNGLDATFTTATCPPTATTGAANSITLTGATLNGTVNPNGNSTTASFEYGTTVSYGNTTTSQSLGSGTTAVSLSGAGITGLTCGTTYHFRVVATNIGGTTNGLDATFATTACAPAVTTGVASSITLTGATLNGTVNPNGASTTASFEYGPTTSYGSATTSQSLGSGTSAVSLSGGAITGLTCGTTYHFRVVATNVGGTTNGLDATFATTACAPAVTTGVASSISLTGATLNGTVNPNGASTTASFEYGPTAAYGSTTTSQSLGSGTSGVSLSGGAITGLTCGTTYHFRVVATNVGGTTNGVDATFATTACPPNVSTGVASSIGLTGATLNGTVNPNGASTTASFEYGPTTSYGSATTAQSLGSGTTAVSLSGAGITGLTCGTTYHFRVVATNVGGTTNGLDATFATTACPPAVTTGVASSISLTGATLNGAVNPNGASTTASFEYGPTTSYGSATTSQSLGSGTSAVSLTGGAITGLTCGTTYHFRVVATNVGGTTNGLDATFATTACAPAVTTGVASSISLTGATLNGTVNPNGASTTASFEYGPTAAYGSATTSQSLGSGTSVVSLGGGAITGLTCGTTYHFRVVATNVGGTTNGVDATFATTACPPNVSTGVASSISLTGATLNGTVNPNGASTTASFQYGTTTSYGSATTSQSLGSGTSAVSLSGGAITGLTCGTTYHFRVVATNIGGTTNGLDATFATTACPPPVITGVAIGITLTGATLTGTVNPNGASTTALFEYGTTTSYGSATTLENLGSGTSAVSLSGGAITGLTCGTTYHFRVVATNIGGTTNGLDATFATTACPPTVTTGVASSISPTGATLNGTVNPNGASTTALFQYGTTTSYGSATTSQSLGSGTSAVSLSGGTITGLTCGMTYHFRVVATNIGGTTNGLDANFATSACPSDLSINDVTVTEGNSGTTIANFTVSLSPAAAGTATVAYVTANGTATAGNDYVSTTGTLTFTAGQTTQTISVLVNGETTPEANETFFVNLSSPTGPAVIADSQGLGTITDDDTLVSCSAAAAPGGTIAVQVFGGSSATDWLALYANSSAAPSAYLSWGYVPLPRPQTVNMTAPTAPGTYNIRLWPNNTATAMLGSCNVVVAAAPTLAINDVTVIEGNAGTSNATFTVSLTPAAGVAVTVGYGTANGTATSGSDYVSTTGTLTFTAGQTTQTVSVPINGDTTPEANETFSVNLSGPTGGAVIGDPLGVGTITNDDALMICPASAAPGGTIAVQVFGGSSATDWLALYTNSSAAPSGYLSWGYVPLPRPQTVNMTAPTAPGTYNIRLWPNNTATAALGSCNVVVAAAPTLAINDVTMVEGNSGTTSANFTVTLTPAAGGTVTVAYATANGTATSGSDYVSTTGTLTFTAGQTTQTVSVPINGDTTPEANETFFVNLSGPTGGAVIGDGVGAGSITNDDALMICPASAAPGGTIAVQVFGGSSATDWLALYTNSSAAPSGHLSWGYVPLPRPQTVNMTAPTAPGTYNIRLWPNNTATAALGSCNVVVAAAPTLAINDVTMVEGNSGTTSANFTVTLTPAAGGTVTVAYATANGTATSGSDYVPTTGTLTFTAGQTTQTVSVPINGDTTPEANETFFVNLSGPTGGAVIGDGVGAGSITTDDALVSCPASAAPGGTIAIQVFGGASATDWVALYSDGAPNNAYGNNWAYVPLPRPQTVNLTASSTPGNYDIRVFTNNGFGLIGNCDIVVAVGPALSVNDVTVTEGNSGTTTATFTVSLVPAAAETVTVVYATANATATEGSDYVSATGTLTFTAGQAPQTVSVTINGDTTPEANETFFVNLSSPTGPAVIGDAQGLGTITNDDPLLGCPASVAPGGTIVTQVFGGASATDWIALYTDGAPNNAYGNNWAYVPLPRPQTVNLTAPSTPGNYDIRLFANNGFGVLGTCDIVVAASPTLSVNDVTVTEGNSGTTNANFTVSLVPAAAETVTVAYATANATATAGSDYATTTGTLTFAAGQTTQTVSVPINGDTTPEATETFFVNLSSPTGTAAIGDSQGLGTITNDDALMSCPASVAPGGTIPIQVFGGTSATDWVALYTDGAPNNAYGTNWAHVPLPRPRTVNLTTPSVPGNYDIRLFANNSSLLLGTCDIVVAAVP